MHKSVTTKTYQHTQTGWLALVANAFGFMVAFWVLSLVSLDGAARTMLLLLVIGLVLTTITFSSLTTSVDGENFRAHFGPLKWPGKTVELADIAGALSTRTSMTAGWGIRITTRGWLYSVSGRGAIIVGLCDNKQFLIGTDDPEGLAKAINDALPHVADFSRIRGA
jgi:hypothetical protein